MHSVTHPRTGYFDSEHDFQQYFKEHDDLQVPPGTPLEIHHLSEIASEEDLQTREEVRILSILNRILLPLAKTISFEFIKDEHDSSIGGNITYHIGDSFRLLSASSGLKFHTEKDTIYTRLTDLFQAMITSSIEKVEFVPGQKLIVMGISDREWSFQGEDIGANIQRLIGPRVPAGFQVNAKFKGECFLSNGEALNAIYPRQISMTIKGAEGMALSISEHGRYTFSMDGFRKRMQVKGELRLPPGQTLRILDTDILGLRNEYENTPFLAKISKNLGQFVLNQILLPHGKTLIINAQGNDGYHLLWGNDFLEISSQEGVILTTTFGSLVTNLHNLGRAFINHHLSYLKLHPQQELIIYGFAEEHRMQLTEWVASGNSSLVINGLKKFLFPYNPIGFTWNLQFADLYTAHLSIEGQDKGALLLRSESLKIGLENASGPWFVINLLNNSSPELIEGIKGSDEDAFIYLLFKAMFYHCCDDFRNKPKDQIDYFKETTQIQIHAVLQDMKFTDSLRKVVLEEPEIHLQLSRILKMTPAEFKQLDYNTLPEPLLYIHKKLMELVYTELQGGHFLTQYLQQVTIALENGTLQSFIRPKPAPQPSVNSSFVAGCLEFMQSLIQIVLDCFSWLFKYIFKHQ